jgi:hypothetical protein
MDKRTNDVYSNGTARRAAKIAFIVCVAVGFAAIGVILAELVPEEPFKLVAIALVTLAYLVPYAVLMVRGSRTHNA